MKWEKTGLLYRPDGQSDWARHTFMTPTPFLRDDGTVRLYGGFRDDAGVSRIGYVDLERTTDAAQPFRVARVSARPCLDIGEPGTFDDNGVIMGDVIRCGDELRLYYVGFQLVNRVKFMAFSGLAVSTDGGETFRRHSRVPVMDRSADSPNLRAIHTVLFEDGVFKVWYTRGRETGGWQVIDGVPYPAYNIWYTESRDGIAFDREDTHLCVDVQGAEYRIGRPRVYRTANGYALYYTRDFLHRDYVAGYAESADGKIWTRKDGELGIEKSTEGWDSQMVCYPVIVEQDGQTFMFYSGNEFGRAGLGCARLIGG